MLSRVKPSQTIRASQCSDNTRQLYSFFLLYLGASRRVVSFLPTLATAWFSLGHRHLLHYTQMLYHFTEHLVGHEGHTGVLLAKILNLLLEPLEKKVVGG